MTQKLLDNSRSNPYTIRLLGRDANGARWRLAAACQLCRRQAMLGAALALTPLLNIPARADDQPDETTMRPQIGDHFVFLEWAQEGPTRPSRRFGARRPASAGLPGRSERRSCATARRSISCSWCASATTALMSRRAQLSADGVVAYSAICTHQACPVIQWSTEKKAMVCSCHGSTYDPKNSAKVIFGPAPLPLAGLPLKSDNGLLDRRRRI